MKTKQIFLLICILVLGFAGKSGGQGITDAERSEIEREVDSVFLGMVKAAANVDYDKISLGVDDRYKAGFIINNSYFSKYESMIDVLNSNLRSGTKQVITIQNKKITVLSGSIVLLTASGIADVDLNNGQSFKANFFWSIVYEKINDVWKVIQSHQSQSN